MPESLRGVVIAIAIGIAALWVAPALVLPWIAVGPLEASGISVELEGVRPALPWGAKAARVVVSRESGKIELTEVAARIGLSGMRLEARVEEGTLLLKTRGLRLRGELLRFQSVPLEALDGLALADFGLRGPADGVFRFGPAETLEATVQRGVIVLRAPLALEIPFAQVVVVAAREDTGAWRVDFADLRGPPLSGTATGRIGADGQLALRVEISQLEEPALTAFRMAEIPTGPLPYTAELGGTLARPRFVRVSAALP